MSENTILPAQVVLVVLIANGPQVIFVRIHGSHGCSTLLPVLMCMPVTEWCARVHMSRSFRCPNLWCQMDADVVLPHLVNFAHCVLVELGIASLK